MKKNMFKDILITGFAMFAIFFGSGNLIFPPQVGLLSGEYVFWAIGGLALSGILFPMLVCSTHSMQTRKYLLSRGSHRCNREIEQSS